MTHLITIIPASQLHFLANENAELAGRCTAERTLLSIFLHINSTPMHHARHQNLNTPCYRVLTGGCTLYLYLLSGKYNF